LILGTKSIAEEDNLDLVGEIANTISGYARLSFGSDFNISIPTVIGGIPDSLNLILKVPIYVIPINWREHKAYLVVGIEK